MSEVAKELGVSKDVVKYHRRSISDDLIEKKDGEVYVSPEGVEWIKGKLKKDKYHANFEAYTRAKLKESTGMLHHIYDLLQTRLIVEPSLAKLSNEEQDQAIDLGQLIKTDIESRDFITWYSQVQNIDEWADWRYRYILLADYLEYLEQKQAVND